MKSNTLNVSGILRQSSWGEADDILYVSSIDEPLAEFLKDRIDEKQVSVRYWITDKESTKEEAQESFLRYLAGDADARLESAYSEYTGYLWTDEWVNIGGHDIIEELSENIGKWLTLEIEIHTK